MGERRRLQDGRGEASASSVVRAVSHSFGEGIGNWRRGPSDHARRDCCCSRTATALECNPPGPSHGGGWVLSGPVWCLVKGSAPGREEREDRETERQRDRENQNSMYCMSVYTRVHSIIQHNPHRLSARFIHSFFHATLIVHMFTYTLVHTMFTLIVTEGISYICYI